MQKTIIGPPRSYSEAKLARRRSLHGIRLHWRRFVDGDGLGPTVWLCKFVLLCSLMFLTVAGLAKLDRMTGIHPDNSAPIDAAALVRRQ